MTFSTDGFAHELEQRLFASSEDTEAAAESNVDLRRTLCQFGMGPVITGAMLTDAA